MLAENPAGLAVRPVTSDDIATVVEFRTRMFRELGWRDEARLSQVEPLFASYLAEELERGGCSGFIAENVESDGTVTPAGTVVIVWQRVPRAYGTSPDVRRICSACSSSQGLGAKGWLELWPNARSGALSNKAPRW